MFNLRPIQLIKLLFSVAMALHAIEFVFSLALVAGGVFMVWVYYFTGGQYIIPLNLGVLALLMGSCFAYRCYCGVVKKEVVSNVH